MNREQSNYFNMAKAVIDVFSNNMAVWQSNTLMTGCFQRLISLRTEVNNMLREQQGNTPLGHTTAKEQSRAELQARLFAISIRLKAYAQLENNSIVEVQANVSRSSFDRLSINNLLTYARAIAEICRNQLPVLQPYQISQPDIDALDADIDRTATLNAHRDVVMDTRVENTSHLSNLFGLLRKELKLMDTLVDAYVDNETFMSVYFNARRIHDIHGRKAPKKVE